MYSESLNLRLHYAIYRLRSYSNSLIHILSLSISHKNVASSQKSGDDKSHRVIVTLPESVGWGAVSQSPKPLL